MTLSSPLAEIDALFEQLLALPEIECEMRLAQIDVANAKLARSLRRLLELAQASDTRGLRAIGEAALTNGDDAAPPQIPGYRIERELGRGGMGAVYEAQRDLGGIEQPVAVKVLRRALLGEDELRRFLTEQRILARLSHPNIAGLLDAGSIDGRPWMALERIEGQPIDRALPPPAPVAAVLDAVVQIADALQLAHAHLVVHRDIKPDNVLVDAEGHIKLIDFGIAKLLVEEVGAAATQTGAAPLTLRYASPEQLLGQPVGVPSDIYQLGLLMYRQLTGAWPWDESAQQLPTLRTQPDSEPIAPSERVEDAARKRALRGDLDCIVLRCLRFDPNRRYRSAVEVKEDIQRHLRGDAVLAASSSAVYRLGKFARRHRVAVGSASAAALALLVGLAAFAWQTHVATTQRDRALRAEAQASQRAAELEQVADFQASQLADIQTEAMGAGLRRAIIDQRRTALQDKGSEAAVIEQGMAELEKALDGVNFTNVALGTLDENIFARALAAIDTTFSGQPQVRARLLQTVASTQRSLGLLEQADAPQAEALAIRRRELGHEAPETLASLNGTGLLRVAQGRLDEAEPVFAETLQTMRRVLGDDHPDTIKLIHNIGTLRNAQGKYAEAAEQFRTALDARRRLLGDQHPDTLSTLNALGVSLWRLQQADEAEPLWTEALEGYRRLRGEDHPDTLGARNNMAMLLRTQQRLDEAEQLFRETLASRRRVLGDAHPRTLHSINNLGVLLKRLGRNEEAELLQIEALQTRRRVLGNDHPETLGSMQNVGGLLLDRGDIAGAEALYLESLQGHRRVLGDEHPDTLSMQGNMARLFKAQGRWQDAERVARDTLALRLRILGERHEQVGASRFSLATLLRDTGQYAEAETVALQNEASNRALHGDAHHVTRASVELLVSIYTAWHKIQPRAGHDIKAAQWQARLEPADGG